MVKLNRGLIAIGAEKFEETTSFYEKLFELSPVKVIGHSYKEYQIASLHVGIFKPDAQNVLQFRNTQSGQGLSICFELDDVDDFIQTCRGKGLSMLKPIQTKHGREVFVFDPENNRLIFSEIKRGD